MADASISILYDLYKESCLIASDAVKRRDIAMLFVILAIVFFSFQSFFPSIVDQAVLDFIFSKFGLTLQINLSYVGNVVWLAVLLFTLRYFQTAAFVERQYPYLHRVEDKLNELIGEDPITREGKSYL